MRRWAWVTLLSLGVAAPLLWPSLRPRPSLPPGIQALGDPDKVTVVEFTDFECPFCRDLHPRLVDLLAAFGDRVRHVELNAPLASHPHAQEAARAAVCADLQGRGKQMADALFRAPVLSRSANRELAQELGLELGAFDRCLADPATDARVRAERALLDAAGLEGLPTLFVGSTKLVGAQPTEVLRKELERALRPDRRAHLPAPLFVGLLGLVIATVVALGHPRRRGRLVPSASRSSTF
jgi:predicted DsbA family dithiol-disulfide isomerase